MKKFYINLDRCERKRLDTEEKFPDAIRIPAVNGREETPESILPYKADRDWRDPYWKRRMTKGEVGCILSHIEAWKRCVEVDEAIIVLEDDAQIIDPDWESKIFYYKGKYEFLWFGNKNMCKNWVSVDDNLETGGMCYWTLSYYITPKVAKIMLDYCENNPLIPADELMPAVLGGHRDAWRNQGNEIKWAKFKQNLLHPVDGAFNESATESLTDIWEDFEFRIATCSTDNEKAWRLPLERLDNIGEGVEWKGGTMEGPGGGQKINLMKEYLDGLDDNDIVMFVDGYDTFIGAATSEILKRYFEMRHEVVFSAEPLIWPDKSLAEAFPVPSVGAQRYLNSGTYIGTVKVLKALFAEPIEDHEDDQLYAQRAFLDSSERVCLDYESYIFFCLSGNENNVAYRNGWVVNTTTRCTSCVIHGNGGGRTKDLFEDLYWRAQDPLRKPSHPRYKKEVPDRDIIVAKGLVPLSWCQRLIDACEADGNWRELPNDKFPGQEIRLNSLEDQSFAEDFREFYKNTLVPICEDHWAKLKMHGLRDAFVIRYSGESQTSLPLHHDMSQVSAAIKLNDDYTGGELNFPRQGYNNIDLKAGELVLWPAQVSHPHESLPMKGGVKYGLVMWSGRYDDEPEYYER